MRRVEDDGVPSWGGATVRPVILLSEKNKRIPGSSAVTDGGDVVLFPLDPQTSLRFQCKTALDVLGLAEFCSLLHQPLNHLTTTGGVSSSSKRS
jgi:hypothetical protein